VFKYYVYMIAMGTEIDQSVK